MNGRKSHRRSQRKRKPTQKPKTPLMRRVLYGEVDGGEGPSLVFVRPDEAEVLRSIRTALTSSQTWGEFRSRIPAREYARVLAMVGLDTALTFRDFVLQERDSLRGTTRAQMLTRYRQLEVGERCPLPEDPFSTRCIPQFSDGDYPEWPKQTMLKWVPRAIQRQFGEAGGTTFNGPYLQFDLAQEREIVAAFRAAGYRCIRDEVLVRQASGW